MAGFLDRVVDGINKGVTDVKEGSKSFVEKSSIRTQIQDLEKAKANVFNNMGQLVYQLLSQGIIEVEQCNAMKAEIDAIDQQILERNERLLQIDTERQQAQAQMQMPYGTPEPPVGAGVTCACGHTNKPGAAFCAKCGARLA